MHGRDQGWQLFILRAGFICGNGSDPHYSREISLKRIVKYSVRDQITYCILKWLPVYVRIMCFSKYTTDRCEPPTQNMFISSNCDEYALGVTDFLRYRLLDDPTTDTVISGYQKLAPCKHTPPTYVTTVLHLKSSLNALIWHAVGTQNKSHTSRTCKFVCVATGVLQSSKL